VALLGVIAQTRLALIVALGTMVPCCAQGPTADEYQVKAAYMYNFAKFVEWPALTFESPTQPIVFCVLGQTPLSQALQDAISGKVIDQRPLVFRQFNDCKQAGKCHILFVSTTDVRQLRHILDEIKTFHALTVGEAENFAHEGGIVRFVLESGRVRLEFNLDAAEEAKLLISSKLLSLGRTVRKAKP
jgi:hypothetical protein